MQPQLRHVPAYLINSFLFSLRTKVKAIDERGVVLEDTIFHVQGGGQPSDMGFLTVRQQRHKIVAAQMDRQTALVYHQLESAIDATIGEECLVEIDQQRRLMNIHLHSIGHALDLVVHRLKLGWTTSKGYHFPDNPYVEYKHEGPIDCVALQQQISDGLRQIVASNLPIVTKVLSPQEALQEKLVEPDFKGCFVRIVNYGESWCPCGGTHVQSTSQLPPTVQITKVSKKGKAIKVFYSA